MEINYAERSQYTAREIQGTINSLQRRAERAEKAGFIHKAQDIYLRSVELLQMAGKTEQDQKSIERTVEITQ